MTRLFAKSRRLLVVVALAVVTAISTVSTAHAASPEAGARANGGAVLNATSASSTPCSFLPALTCQSTNPAVTLNIYYSGDTSDCTFAWEVLWGDGRGPSNRTVTDPPDGYVVLAGHTYAATGEYAITVTGQVTSGN